MIMIRAGLLIGGFYFLILLGGCSNPDKEDSFYIDEYFDIKGLIDDQLTYYQDSSPPQKITKVVGFENQTESQEQAVSKIEEIKQILETTIINKPGLRGAYEVNWNFGISSRGDTTYSIQTNSLKPGEDATVEELKAFYKGPPKRKNLYRVHIYKNTSNLLYKNTQVIVLQLKTGLLRELTMRGYQQILNFEPENYRLSMRIKP